VHWVQKTTLAEYNFYPTPHMIFPCGSVMPGSRRPNIWSVDSVAVDCIALNY